MPSLSLKKRMLSNNGANIGEAHKNATDAIFEATWYRDIATRTCYFFDMNHEFDPFLLNNIDISGIPGLTPVDCKYIINQKQTYSKDQISYHLQFKPSFDLNNITEYYKEYFIDRYDAEAPCGLYVLIPDNKGRYNRWLVVERANINDPQFPTFEILRCDYTLNYIIDGTVWDVAAVSRSQNSYIIVRFI